MLGAGGAGNHLRNVHGNQVQCGEDGDVHLLADADDRNIAVLDTGFCQGFFVQGIDNECIFGVCAHFANLFLVAIQDNQIVACIGKVNGERIAESAEPDDPVDHTFLLILLCHIRFLSISQ